MLSRILSKIHNLQDTAWVRQTGLVCFYIALVTETLIVIADKSAWINPLEGRLFQVTFALCVVKVLFTKYEWREYIAIFLCCLVGLLTDQISGRNEILRVFMFVAACHGTDLRKNLKVVFKITLVGSILIVLLSVLGVLGTVTVPKEYVDGTQKTLFCFGMGNANAFHCMFFVICLLGMYLYHEGLKWWMYLMLLAADIGMFFLTRSKTATGMLAIAVMGMWIISKWETTPKQIPQREITQRQITQSNDGGKGAIDKSPARKQRAPKVTGIIMLAVNAFCVAVSVFFAAQAWRVHDWDWEIYRDSSSELIVRVNEILTGRLRCLTETDPWTGTIDTWKLFAGPNTERYFDLGFVRLFYWYGIIPAALILTLFGVLLIYLYRKEKYTEILFLTICSVYTVVEAHFVSVYIARCYPLILFGAFGAEMMNKENWKSNISRKI